jgi:hypothetical protein
MPPKHFTQKSGGLRQVPGVLPVENLIEIGLALHTVKYINI